MHAGEGVAPATAQPMVDDGEGRRKWAASGRDDDELSTRDRSEFCGERVESRADDAIQGDL